VPLSSHPEVCMQETSCVKIGCPLHESEGVIVPALRQSTEHDEQEVALPGSGITGGAYAERAFQGSELVAPAVD
jgi:hypothetical protein